MCKKTTTIYTMYGLFFCKKSILNLHLKYCINKLKTMAKGVLCPDAVKCTVMILHSWPLCCTDNMLIMLMTIESYLSSHYIQSFFRLRGRPSGYQYIFRFSSAAPLSSTASFYRRIPVHVRAVVFYSLFRQNAPWCLHYTCHVL